jgi:nifR3 family TIM-barrel protein
MKCFTFATSFFPLKMNDNNAIAKLLSQYDFPLYLAPMEEVTDPPFRRICKNLGADIMISEFISSDALIRNVDVSLRKLTFDETERPFGIQIFGHTEEALREAAEVAEAAHPDFIDINWGCPVKKVVNKGAGSAILKDIPKMVRLTSAVVNSVKLPVTVKTRLGWDELNKNIVSAAEQLQDIGIQAIAIHGRTRSQLYRGTADWTLIGEVKNNPRMTIPVIGNGDINSAAKALEYKDRYGVDAIMIGRAAIGNPWIFKEIKDFYYHREFTPPTYNERVEMAMLHLRTAADWKGEKKAVFEMRRHYAAYFKGITNFKPNRIRLMDALTIAECEAILKDHPYYT